jgi:crotonobetainyl-CoA:carnitine CoA-transferase CaiB-like acyl-CoA transferase
MIRVSSSRCKRSGEGQYIDLASQETIAALSGDGLLDYIMNQRVPKRRGNRDDLMAPHNCYRCRGADHWVSIAVATGELLGLSPDEIPTTADRQRSMPGTFAVGLAQRPTKPVDTSQDLPP